MHPDAKVELKPAFDDTLAADWDALHARSDADAVFLAAGWLRAWQDTLGRARRVVVAIARRDGQPVAAAAFAEIAGTVEFAGTGPSDYSDFLMDRTLGDTDAKHLIERLLDAATTELAPVRHLRLSRLQPESRTRRLLLAPGGRYRALVSDTHPAPTMDMATVADKLRKKSLKRHDNALRRRGQVTASTFAEGADIVPLLDAFFDQHVRRWQSTDSPSLFLDPEKRSFYRAVVSRLAPSGALRFTTVTLDGALVAAHFGFLRAGRFIWYKPSYEPDLAELSPGEVLIKNLLERAREEGATEFDFTIGAEAFKLRFATRVRDVADLYVTRSWSKYWIKRARVALKQIVRRLQKR